MSEIGFFRWLDLEQVLIWQIFLLIWISQMFTWVVKKCLNLTFKVTFLCQKSIESFWFFFHLRVSVYKKVFLLLPFFENFNFWTTLFSVPDFWQSAWKSLKIKSKNVFILLIFCKNLLPVHSRLKNSTTEVTLRSLLLLEKKEDFLKDIWRHLYSCWSQALDTTQVMHQNLDSIPANTVFPLMEFYFSIIIE